MATRVVLYHSSQGHQMGGATCLSLGSSTAAGVMGQKGLDWGPSKEVPLLQGRIRDILERERSLWS